MSGRSVRNALNEAVEIVEWGARNKFGGSGERGAMLSERRRFHAEAAENAEAPWGRRPTAGDQTETKRAITHARYFRKARVIARFVSI